MSEPEQADRDGISTRIEACIGAILDGGDPEAALAPLDVAQRAEVKGALAARESILARGRSELPPDRIGPFRLERPLGRGGQGEVWLALDERIPRTVALKVLDRAVAATPELLARFRREAAVAARLEHPSIATVYEAGAADGHAYLAMRYVEGRTLAQIVAEARGGAPLGFDALAAFELCARALHTAHVAGVVHRDLKPQNIIVQRDGVPVLVDFGLADDVRDGALDLTRAGQVLGTPAYLSPERISPGFGAPDQRSDLWSLAATFWEVLALRRLFDAPTREGLYRQILEAEPAPLRGVRPALPRDLAVVLATALAKPMHRRYATALDLAEDLRRVRCGEPIRARPTPAAVRAAMWIARHRALVALAGLALFAVLLALAIVATMLSGTRLALGKAERRLRVAEAQLLAEKDPGAALRAWLALADAEAAPRAIVNDAVLSLLERTSERGLLAGHAGRVHDLAFSGDGRLVATACADRRVRAFAAAGQELRWSVTVEHEPTALAFAGSLLLVGDAAGGLQALREGEVVWRTALGPAAVTALACVPGTLHVVVGTASGQVALHDAAGPSTTRPLHATGPVTRIVCASREPVALVASSTGSVEVLELPDGRRKAVLDHGRAAVNDLALDATGSLLVCASDDNTLWVWSVASLTPLRRLHGHESAVLALAVHPDGKTLASGSADRSVLLWGLEGGAVRAAFTAHARPVRRVQYAPAGDVLATADDQGDVRLWHAGPREGLLRLDHGEAGGDPPLIRAARFAPDGRRLATLPHGQDARLWDATTGACVRELTEPAAMATDLCFAPDGRLLALACADATVLLYDPADGRLVRRIAMQPPELPVERHPTALSVLFAPGSDRLLILTDAGRAELCEVDTGRVVAELFGLARFYTTGTVGRAAFRPDGRWLATVLPELGGTRIGLWRADDGERVATIAGHTGQIEALQFSPDGSLLVSAAVDGTARVVAVGEQGSVQLRCVLSGHAGCVVDAQFSPDGKEVLTASVDMTARLWDAATGTRLATYGGHDGLVYAARFAPDGERVLTASWDHTATIFARRSGELLARYRNHSKAVLSAEWSPDGRTVVTASGDGTARTWPSDPVGFARRKGG